jgi:hypothetical protein
VPGFGGGLGGNSPLAGMSTCALKAVRAQPLIGRLFALAALAVLCLMPLASHAQAGPPYLSNDPGTPGNGIWEINLAVTPSITRTGSNYQLPQIDLNFGLGERIQLTYQVPYVLSTASATHTQDGWGNAYIGVKWRFVDQGGTGWQISGFPQLQTGLSASAEEHGLGGPGPRLLLPVEAAHKVGPLDVDAEAGFYVPVHGLDERILGLVIGHTFHSSLELDVELYDDRAVDGLPRQTTLDVGGRFPLHAGVIALFMAGRSICGTNTSQPQFMGYFGVQILLSHYGAQLNAASH